MSIERKYSIASSEPPLSDKEMTPLPFQTLFTLCIVILAEPMSFTIIFPFVYYLVRDFNLSDNEKDIGMYAGLIASSFSLAQFFTSLWWGWLSDRVGRRPILLIGLFGNFVTMILFGFSKSLVWAIATRSACGFLNGNVGVAKCILGEITDETNQAKAFSLYGLVFDIGLLIGPIIGGLLANPAKLYPSVFGSVELFITYPYLLPCLFGSVFSLIGFFVGLFGFKETLRVTRVDDEEPLLQTESEEPIRERPAKWKLSTTSKFCILCYAVLAFATVLMDELFPLWTAADISIGGLGFQSSDIGLAMAFMGAVGMPSQIFIYPWIQKKFGLLPLYKYSMLAYVISFAISPFVNDVCSRLGNHSPYLWAFLLFTLFLKTTAAVFGFTSIMIMITNSCPNNQLGTVHGISQTAAALVRAVGPAVAGNLWTWSLYNTGGFPFDYHFMFILNSIISLVGFVVSFLVQNDRVERKQE